MCVCINGMGICRCLAKSSCLQKRSCRSSKEKSSLNLPQGAGASTWWANCSLLWWTLLLHEVFKCHGMFYNIFDSCIKIGVCLYVYMLVNLFGCNHAETLPKLAPCPTLVFMVSPLLLPPKSPWWYCGHVCWFASFGPIEQKLLNFEWVGLWKLI